MSCQRGCPRAVYHASVTPEEHCRGQSVTVLQDSVFVPPHAMERTAAAADPVSWNNEGMEKKNRGAIGRKWISIGCNSIVSLCVCD